MSCDLRFGFVFISIMIWIGIFLTGFNNIHWFLYLPAVGTFVVAISGKCIAGNIARALKICR